MKTVEKFLKTDDFFNDCEFYGENPADLVIKYKKYSIFIGNLNQGVYASIKTDLNLIGRGTIEKKLPIFTEDSDRYNSYGWKKMTDLPHWQTSSTFIKLIMSNCDYRRRLHDIIIEMKEAIDKFLIK